MSDSNIEAACTMLTIERLKTTCETLVKENAKLQARVEALESDLKEQCQLNAMGQDRELKLLARVKALEAEDNKNVARLHRQSAIMAEKDVEIHRLQARVDELEDLIETQRKTLWEMQNRLSTQALAAGEEGGDPR